MKKLATLFATFLLMLAPIASVGAASDADELVPVEQIAKPDDGKAVKPQSYRQADAPKKMKKTKKAKKTGKSGKKSVKPVRKHRKS